MDRPPLEYFMTSSHSWRCSAAALLLSCCVSACSSSDPAAGKPVAPGGTAAPASGKSATGEKLSGSIQIDGSSTVFPISEAVSEEFNKTQTDVKISVGRSGTGGGFQKFCRGEIDINDASRPISKKEIKDCQDNKIEYIEFTIATDAITLVINKENTFCECLSVEQLKSLWQPDSKITTWKELDPKWPDEEIRLFGADVQSGTFDFFTEVIVGKAKSSRTKYTPASDDNVLVSQIATDKQALGYIPYSYFVQNQEKLKAVGIKNTGSKECVLPSPESVEDGTYKPLSRPLFLCVNKKALARPEVRAFVEFYLSDEGQKHVERITQVTTYPDMLKKSREALAK